MSVDIIAWALNLAPVPVSGNDGPGCVRGPRLGTGIGAADTARAHAAAPEQRRCSLSGGQGGHGDTALSEGAQSRHQNIPASLDVQPAAAGCERAARVVEIAQHFLVSLPHEPGLVRAEVQFLRHATQGNEAMPPARPAAAGLGQDT